METPHPPATSPAARPEAAHAPEIAENDAADAARKAEAAPNVTGAASAEIPEPVDAPAQRSGATVSQDDADVRTDSDAGPDGAVGAAAFDPDMFDEALDRVISSACGEILFRFTSDDADGDTVAAVRLGGGEDRIIALVILPPDGGSLRVEPVEGSVNPLAPLAKSYASLVDAWKAAA